MEYRRIGSLIILNPESDLHNVNKVSLENVSARLISMSEAATGTPHSAEYLSLLARKQKLPAQKVDNVWYTTREALNEYLEKQRVRAELLNGNFNTLKPQVAAAVPEVLKKLRSLFP